jgi:hypothetical protein
MGDRGTLLKWPPVAWVSQVRFSPRWSCPGTGILAATAAAATGKTPLHVTTFFNYFKSQHLTMHTGTKRRTLKCTEIDALKT